MSPVTSVRAEKTKMRYTGHMTEEKTKGDMQSAQFKRMTGDKVSKLILRLAFPTIISMLVTGIYNTADTFFVSQLGTSASAAVGIVFSIMAIIQAMGFTLGMGAGSLVSLNLGKKNKAEADKFASTAFFAAIGLGCVITVCGLVWIDELMLLLGSTSTILPYSTAYARYIFIGAPVMCASFVLNNTLRSEGHAAFSMIGLTTGGILNIVLDPIFIFALDLGTAGAAIATLISQCVSFLILLQFFLRRKGIVHVGIHSVSRDFRDFANIIKIGFPSLCRQGLASISTVMLNVNAAAFSDAAVAGMSIVNRIVLLVGSAMIGLGQGFTPVSGYNYGAKCFDRVKKAYAFTVKTGFFSLLAAAALLFGFAPQIVKLFRDDPEVIRTGSAALRYLSVSLPLHAFIVSTNMLMQSCGKSLQATFLACNRQGVYFIPLIIILPKLIGLQGVEMTQAASDILSALTAIPYVIWFFKKDIKKAE